MPRLFSLFCLWLLCVLLLCCAQSSARARADVHPAQTVPTLDASREAASLAFAEEHHPQLASLLSVLEERDPLEYGNAVAEISRTAERLERVHMRDRERYELELTIWKVDSRIRLLAARMARDDRISLEQQLKSLLSERSDLRLKQLRLEKQRLEVRIGRVDQQIRQLQAGQEALIDRETERLRRSVRSRTSEVNRQRSRPDDTVRSGNVESRPDMQTRDGRHPEKPAVRELTPGAGAVDRQR
jgi:hypothetical protein